MVLLPPEQLLQDARSFLRALGALLHTNLRIKRDAQGDLMVYPYYGEGSAAGRKQRMARRSLPGDGEQEVAGWVFACGASDLDSEAGHRDARGKL